MSSHSELRRTSSRSSVRRTLRRLVHVRARVRVDLLAGEHRPGGRAPARVAHARGVVADDQDDGVAEVLELAQLLQHDGVAEVQVGRGRVQAELDAQRAALGEALLERAARAGTSTALRARCAAVGRPRGDLPSGPMLESAPRGPGPPAARARPRPSRARRLAARAGPPRHERSERTTTTARQPSPTATESATALDVRAALRDAHAQRRRPRRRRRRRQRCAIRKLRVLALLVGLGAARDRLDGVRDDDGRRLRPAEARGAAAHATRCIVDRRRRASSAA